MSPSRYYGLVLCLALLLVARSVAADSPEPVRVLFVGNSYTAVNSLPGMLTTLAKAGNRPPLEVAQVTPGGCTLQRHWEKSGARERIQSGDWDYVVLQEQSMMPIVKPALMHEYAHRLVGEINKRNAKTVFYLTWSREHTPETQEKLNEAYRSIADELNAEVAPVGPAWAAARKADEKVSLYKKDKSHPTPAGTYLAACVFYATIFGESPEGLPGQVAGLEAEQARRLQRIAWRTVQSNDSTGP